MLVTTNILRVKKVLKLNLVKRNKKIKECIQTNIAMLNALLRKARYNVGNPKIEIKQADGKEGIFTEIYVDGHKLRGVRSFELKQEVGNSIPVLTVDLNALNLSTDLSVVLKQKGYGEIEVNIKEPSENDS